MIFPLILAAAVQAAPAAAVPTPPSDAQKQAVARIVETSARWKGGIEKQDGELSCLTKASSGDLEVDALRCDAMLVCVRQIEDGMDTLDASEGPEADRKRKMRELVATLTPCLAKENGSRVAALADKRVGG